MVVGSNKRQESEVKQEQCSFRVMVTPQMAAKMVHLFPEYSLVPLIGPTRRTPHAAVIAWAREVLRYCTKHLSQLDYFIATGHLVAEAKYQGSIHEGIVIEERVVTIREHLIQ